SKYLSFILRHEPQSIGLTLDTHGWADIDALITGTTQFALTPELLDIVVETNDKQRFSVSADGQRIRANQGHSIAVDLDLRATPPPASLLHGTAEQHITAIQRLGLLKMQRHHVHLTEHMAVATAVGRRYGKPVVIQIDAQAMAAQGYSFYKSVNNVW